MGQTGWEDDQIVPKCRCTGGWERVNGWLILKEKYGGCCLIAMISKGEVGGDWVMICGKVEGRYIY